MTELKTLAEIWESNDRRPISVVSERGRFRLIGVYSNRGFFDLNLIQAWDTANDPIWKVVAEPPEPRRLWPAIIWDASCEKYVLSRVLHDSESIKMYDAPGQRVVRLANADDFKNGFLIEEEG